MKGIKIIIGATLIAVIASALVMGILSSLKSHYRFMYIFIVTIANIIFPVLGGVVLFHLLLNYLSKQFASLDKLVGKLLLSVASAILFAALFIGVDTALFGLSENMLREYRGWLPVALITSVAVPIVYHMFRFSKGETKTG
jgi:uncharacterized membrane protein YjjB (DUF3815 family)